MYFFRRLIRSLRTRSRREAIAGWFLEMSVLLCGVSTSLEFMQEGGFSWRVACRYLIGGLICAGIGLYWTRED